MFFLILFGYITIHITKNVDGNTFKKEEVIVEDTANECSTCGGSSNEEKIIEDNYVIYNLEGSDVVDISQEVKQATISNLCEDAANRVDLLRRLCKASGVDLHHEVPKQGKEVGSSGGKINTEKINGFRLTKVTYPLAFWLGKYTMASSNREITTTDLSTQNIISTTI